MWDEYQYIRDIIISEQNREMKSSFHVTTRIDKQTNKQKKTNKQTSKQTIEINFI